MWEQYFQGGKVLYWEWEEVFDIVIFGKNASKYAELMAETYACDNLNQI